MSNDNREIDGSGFWAWFDSARGSISVREVERRANIPRGRIGNARSGNFRPTLDICQAVAAGLRLPVKDVLRQARLVGVGEPASEYEETLILQVRQLTGGEQKLLLEMIQALVEYRGRRQESIPYLLPVRSRQ